MDHAAEGFGAYAAGRIREYEEKVREKLTPPPQQRQSGKGKGKGGSKASSKSAEARRNATIRDMVERFAKAIRSGEPMAPPSTAKPGKVRSLRDLAVR